MPFRVVAVGEVLWDLLPSEKQLGGAPANFACHVHALGADTRLVTRVGADPLGREAVERLRLLGLPTESVGVDPEAPTGTVNVEVRSDGQPHFTIREAIAWDRLTADEGALDFAAEADAVCFGSLAQRDPRSRRAIRTLVGSTRPGAWRVFDANLRPPFVVPEVLEASLGLSNVLKLNEQELPALAGMLGLPGDPDGQMAELARRYGLALVALTRGAAGSLSLARGQWSDHGGLPAEVCDTVGAGDAFTATVLVGLLSGWPLDRINQAANEVAAFVCTQPGATPALPEDIRRRYALQERGELAGLR
jgi:fructokinase